MVTIVASLTTATARPGRAWSATEDDLALAERIETINDRDVSSCAALDEVQVAVPCVDAIVDIVAGSPEQAFTPKELAARRRGRYEQRPGEVPLLGSRDRGALQG